MVQYFNLWKKRALTERFQELEFSSTVAHSFSSGAVNRRCGKAPISAKPFEKVIHQAVEIRIALAEVFNLANRVNHRRVMFAAEAAPDLGQRRVRERFAQIHRDLARHRD